MSKPLTAALSKLVNSVAGNLAASALSKAQRNALESFARQTGCVRVQMQGRGVAYVVVDSAVLASHYRMLCPDSIQSVDLTLPPRAANIARSRNSKGAAHHHDNYYLLMKSTGDQIIWHNGDGIALDLSVATASFGAAALSITTDDSWNSYGNQLWLVENKALFDRLDWLPEDAHGSVVYYGGQLNNLLISWLANRQRFSEIILFPDYDGVGLQNYSRLSASLATNCQFWLMPDWLKRLLSYGSHDLWEKTLKEFSSVATEILNGSSGVNSDIRLLITTMKENGLALEQEAVWLKV